MYRDFFENEDFFPSVLAFRPQVSGVFGHQTRRFSKRVPRVDFFSKMPASRFRVDGNEGFRIR